MTKGTLGVDISTQCFYNASRRFSFMQLFHYFSFDVLFMLKVH